MKSILFHGSWSNYQKCRHVAVASFCFSFDFVTNQSVKLSTLIKKLEDYTYVLKKGKWSLIILHSEWMDEVKIVLWFMIRLAKAQACGRGKCWFFLLAQSTSKQQRVKWSTYTDRILMMMLGKSQIPAAYWNFSWSSAPIYARWQRYCATLPYQGRWTSRDKLVETMKFPRLRFRGYP